MTDAYEGREPRKHESLDGARRFENLQGADILVAVKIEIQNGEELNRLLDVLAEEIVHAHIYHQLFRDLVKAIPEYKREVNQSHAFWNMTIEALRDTGLLHLCRVYDQESNSLSLANLLDTIKANVHLFSDEHFRKRMASNPFVDSLAKYKRLPEVADIEKDIETVTTHNSLVKKLIIWRNHIVAHRGAKTSLGKSKVLEKNVISENEIGELLERALDLFNKYSGFYRASIQSSKLIGQDDYKYLFQFLRLGLEKWDENLLKQRRASKARANRAK